MKQRLLRNRPGSALRLSQLLSQKITKRIHSSKPVSLNRPIPVHQLTEMWWGGGGEGGKHRVAVMVIIIIDYCGEVFSPQYWASGSCGWTHIVIVSLDDLQEQRRSILHSLGEYLQQVAVVIIVNQDLQLLQLKPQSPGFWLQVFTAWETTKTSQVFTVWKAYQDKHSECGRTTKTRHSHCGRTKTNIQTTKCGRTTTKTRQTFTLWKDHSQCGRTTRQTFTL